MQIAVLMTKRWCILHLIVSEREHGWTEGGIRPRAPQHDRRSQEATIEPYAGHNSRRRDLPFSLLHQTVQLWTGTASMSCAASGVVLSKCLVVFVFPDLRQASIVDVTEYETRGRREAHHFPAQSFLDRQVAKNARRNETAGRDEKCFGHILRAGIVHPVWRDKTESDVHPTSCAILNHL